MAVTKYFWNPFDDNIIAEYDENGDTIASYTHEPGLHGELISQHRDGQTSYYHYDGEGNTLALTDSNGDVTDTYEYDAFGNVTASSGTTTNPFGFKGALGYYANPETNDYYVRARNYEPVIARWLSADPIGFVDGMNVYTYVVNNPVLNADPSGLDLVVDPVPPRPKGWHATAYAMHMWHCLRNVHDLVDTGKFGYLFWCAFNRGCGTGRVSCEKLNPLVDARFVNGDIEVNAFAVPNVFGVRLRNFDYALGSQILKEEAYHALTICHEKDTGFRQWWKDLEKLMAKNPNVFTKDRRKCVQFLNEEVVAKTCAKRCTTFDQCFIQAMRSKLPIDYCKKHTDKMGVRTPFFNLLRTWYRKVPGYCADIDAACLPTPPRFNPLHEIFCP